VPLDYAAPTGKTIVLGLIRRPASDQANKIGSLLVDNGGPGGSPIEHVRSGGPEVSSGVRDRFDIIGFDPRGVGESTPLECATDTQSSFHHLDPSPDDATEQTALDEGAKAIADDCEANAGELLPHVGTDDVVRDMDTIRVAVGDEKLSYIGYSYGTLLGLRYAELFPDKVRAIVLDGVVDPTQGFETFLREQTIAFEKQVGALLGDAAGDYDALAARVETDPIPAGRERVGPNELATAAIIATYSAGSGSILRRAIENGVNGDGRTLASLDDAYESSVEFAAYAAVECIDSTHPVGAEAYKRFADELTAISPRFGPSIANELLTCAFWGAPVQSIVGPVKAAGAPPLLVIGTTGDAATPYHQAVTVAETLEQSVLLTVNGTGHTSGGNGCAVAATSSYIIDLTLPDQGATC
jgi:pimeloyl-ACP methyl ester carboxylesterase